MGGWLGSEWLAGVWLENLETMGREGKEGKKEVEDNLCGRLKY